MALTWPPALPTEPLAASFALDGDPRGRIATPTDTGPGQQRPRGPLEYRRMKLTIPIPRADFPTFEAFYAATLGNGARPFEFPHPITLATLRVKFPPDDVPGWEAPLERGGKFYLLAMRLVVLP